MSHLTKDEVRQLLRECVTVVKPGETLVIRGDRNWTPNQLREVQDMLDRATKYYDLRFHALVVPGEELGVAEASGAGPHPHQPRRDHRRPLHGALRIHGHLLPFTAAVLKLEAPHPPAPSVAPPVIGGAIVTLEARTEFQETTRAALIAAGWTPPPEPGSEDEALPMRDGAPHCTPGPDGSCTCQPEPA